MKVPLLDLKRQYQSLKNELDEAMLNVAASQMLILGEEVSSFEKMMADYCGTKYALGVSSGTDALLIALMALDIQPDDEVILPTYSFFATAGVVARMHAKPVFVDSDPDSFNIDPDLIEQKITKKTKAILPVHLYGQAAEMDKILAIASKHNIPVIEDAAQAIGVQYKNGKRVGSMGLIGCFSFYPTKNLGAFGDGGLVITNDDKMFDRLSKMRNHGMYPKYYHSFVGGNFRLDAIQAAVLKAKFPHLEKWNEDRRQNAEYYVQKFVEVGLATKTGAREFSANEKVLLPLALYKDSGAVDYHTYNQFIIRVEKRDELRKFLGESGIGNEIYYPVPFHRQECFSYLSNNDGEYTHANSFAESSIALPIYAELAKEEIDYTVSKIKEFIG